MGFAGIAKPISDAIQKTKDARFQIKLNQDAIAENIKEYEDLSKLLRPLTKQEVDRKRELLKQKETLEDQNKELDKQTNKYKNIANSLKEQFTFANAVDFVFTNIASSFLKLNEAQTEFTRETGRNIPHLDTINSSLISSVDYIKTATSLTQQFGFAADAVFSKDTIEAASKL
jgi:chlorite dismutase